MNADLQDKTNELLTPQAAGNSKLKQKGKVKTRFFLRYASG
jgi:hypothetical protein